PAQPNLSKNTKAATKDNSKANSNRANRASKEFKPMDLGNPANYDLRVIVDDSTGVEIALPFESLANETKGTRGKVWTFRNKIFPDYRLTIETLKFSSDTTIREIYKEMVTALNQSIDKDNTIEPTDDMFVIEGIDDNANRFHVGVYQRKK